MASQNNDPYQGAIPIVVDTDQTPQRAIGVNCTVAGDVSLKLADGSSFVITVPTGSTQWPYAVLTVNSVGTTATATYANLK